MLGSDVQGSVPQILRLFIHVLTFADQHPHKVKVALLACSPDVIESFFAVVTLAQVERKSILRRAHIDQHVVVSLPLEQQVANLGMTVVGRVVEWGPLSVILGVNVCSTLEEKHYGCQATLLAGQVQGSALQVVLPLHLCLVDEQSLH